MTWGCPNTNGPHRPAQQGERMKSSVMELVGQYDPTLPLEEASTIPSSWYIDEGIYARERRTTFSRTWQLAGRVDQLREPGQYVTCEIAGEPIVLVRGSDGELRGFFNVCRHHAAAVMTEPSGCAQNLRCPYHGWTYTLEGALKGTPSFNSECHFDRSQHGLAPVATRSEEHTSELQSRLHLVCRLLLEKQIVLAS